MRNRQIAVWGGLLVLYLGLGAFSEYWLGGVTTHPIGDDFKIYYGAYLKAAAGQNPYEPYSIGSGFIYHPFALTFVGMLSLGQDLWGATYIWIALSLAAWVASIWLALRLARPSGSGTLVRARSLRLDRSPLPSARGQTTPRQPASVPGISGREAPGRLVSTHLANANAAGNQRSLAFFGLVCLGFAPFLETLHIGQINTFVCLLMLLALYGSERKRPVLAGLALGLAITLKTSPGLFIPYFLVTRQFRTAFAALASLAVLGLLAVLQFSPRVMWEFAAILPRLGSEVHHDTYNQSALSLAIRGLEFLNQPDHIGLAAALFRIAFLGAASVLLASALFIPPGSAAVLRVWLFALLTTVMVIFPPIIWYHHSALLLWPLAIVLLARSKWLFLIGIGVVGLIQVERLFEHLAIRAAFPVLIAHGLLLGALAVAYFKRWRLARRSATITPNPQ